MHHDHEHEGCCHSHEEGHPHEHHHEHGCNACGGCNADPKAELKALMESYKDRSRGSVLSDLSDRKEETAAAKPSGKAFRHQDVAR